MTCATCRFSFNDPQIKLLVCRRRPPQMTAFTKVYPATTGQAEGEQMQTFFNFPVVDPAWWCGEGVQR